jgi:carboxyl-terminal processing protease
LAIGVLPVTTFILGLVIGRGNQRPPARQFSEVWNYIEDNYAAGPLDQDKMLRSALTGLIGSLHRQDDTFSAYYDPETVRQMERAEKDSTSDLGTITDLRTDPPTIVGLIPNSPAEKAGVFPGDRLLAINGRSASGLTRQGLVTLRSTRLAGKTIRLLIGREGAAEPLQFDIDAVPAAYDLVSLRLVQANGRRLAIIRIADLTGDAAARFDQAADDALKAGIEGLIIDLRGNPGGTVDNVCHIVSAWIGSNSCMMITYAHDNAKFASRLTEYSPLASKPTIVLVDGGSASAAEVMAGALQDYGLAQVVGTQTFGKGVGQVDLQLSDGSVISLVTTRWFTPKKFRSVHNVGLTPDVIVPRTTADFQMNRDPQLDKALELLAK